MPRKLDAEIRRSLCMSVGKDFSNIFLKMGIMRGDRILRKGLFLRMSGRRGRGKTRK